MPPQVGVGVAAVIFRDNNLLMLQRSGAHGAGTWSVPGGWVEKCETILQAAKREVLEETGLQVEPLEVACYTETIHKEGVHDVCFWIVCRDRGGTAEIKEPDKCSALEWVPLHRVRNQKPLFEELHNLIFRDNAWYKIVQSIGMRGLIK